MAETNTYHWKKFTSSGYKITDESVIEISTEGIQLSFIYPFIEDDSLITSFLKNHSSFTIDKKSKTLIEELIHHYKLPIESNSFCALGAVIQQDYIYYFENPINTSSGVYDDLEFEYLQFKQLFDLIEIQLVNEDLSRFENITVKFEEKFTFKSVFIFKELFTSLIEYYDLTAENFNEKKEEILKSKRSIKLDKLAEFHKLKHIKDLYKFITSKKENANVSNEDLRFVVCFLLLSQIPINQMAAEFTVPPNTKDVAISDINNLRKYINGDKKIFY